MATSDENRERLELKLDKMDSKIDHLVEKVSKIEIVLSAQHVTLVDHTQRSTKLEVKMEPIEKHVYMVNGALKFMGLVAILATIAEGLFTVLTYFRKA